MPASVAPDIASEDYGEDVRIIAVTGDASYPTGGYPIPGYGAMNLGTKPLIGLNDATTNIALWDDVNKKVKFIVRATGAEVANTTDVSAAAAGVRLLVPTR